MRIKGLALTLFCCLLHAMIFSCKATSKKSADHVCPIESLLVDSSSLPGPQWQELGGRSYRDVPLRLGIDRVGTSFSGPKGGIVSEKVHRFCNEEEAIDGYNELADYWFSLEPSGTSWTKPTISNNISISPNNYRLECSTSQNVRTCLYVARYGNNAIALKAHMIIIKDQDLFNIIELIDRKAKACTEKEYSLMESCY